MADQRQLIDIDALDTPMTDITVYRTGRRERGTSFSFRGTEALKAEVELLMKRMEAGYEVVQQIQGHTDQYGQVAKSFIDKYHTLEQQFASLGEQFSAQHQVDQEQVQRMISQGQEYANFLELQQALLGNNMEEMKKAVIHAGEQLVATQQVVEHQQRELLGTQREVVQLQEAREQSQVREEYLNQANEGLAARLQTNIEAQNALNEKIERNLRRLAKKRSGRKLPKNWLYRQRDSLSSRTSVPSESSESEEEIAEFATKRPQRAVASDFFQARDPGLGTTAGRSMHGAANPPLPPSPRGLPPLPPSEHSFSPALSGRANSHHQAMGNRPDPSDPSSDSSSDSDSSSEDGYGAYKRWKLRRRMKEKARKLKKRRSKKSRLEDSDEEVVQIQSVEKTKMNAPEKFDGTKSKLETWIFQLERYMAYNRLSFRTDESKVTWLQGQLKGDAEEWYIHRQMTLEKQGQKDTWDELIMALKFKYRYINAALEHEAEMQKLKYTGDIRAYLTKLDRHNFFVNMTGAAYQNLVLRALPAKILEKFGMPDYHTDEQFNTLVEKAGVEVENVRDRTQALGKRDTVMLEQRPKPPSNQQPSQRPRSTYPARNQDARRFPGRPERTDKLPLHTDFREAHKGISEDVIRMRREKKACSRCGVPARNDGSPHHNWKFCRRDIRPTGILPPYNPLAKKVAGVKRAAEDGPYEGEKPEEPAEKKTKTVAMATTEAPQEQRIYEVQSDDEAEADF